MLPRFGSCPPRMSDFLDRAGALFGPVTVSVDHSGTVCVWTVVWWLVHDHTSSAPIQRAAKTKGDRFEFLYTGFWFPRIWDFLEDFFRARALDESKFFVFGFWVCVRH